MREETKPPARVHPEDRNRIEGLKALGVLIGGQKKREPLSYYTPILIQCTLPHSDPKTRDWSKTSGKVSLIISSGVDKNLKPYGIPYGSFPRLALGYIITQVIKTQARRIPLSAHFSEFLREIGYTGNHKGTGVKGRRVRDQLVRLLRASMTFEGREDGHLAVQDVKVAPRFELWWSEKKPDEASLWNSYIEISEEFREAILSAPVPLRTDILKGLHKSPLALDVYMWVSYRLFTMRANGDEAITLGYGRLQEQFGTGISEANYHKFRERFKQALAKVAEHWRDDQGKILLNYDLDTTGLTLYRSPFIVGAARNVTQGDRLRPVPDSRSFDPDTRRVARQAAGQWNLDWLERQYFEWIEREGITPKQLRAHFLDFIQTHRKRNGERP